MIKPTRLPPVELIEHSFSYDPITGELSRNSGKKVKVWNRTSNCSKVRVGQKTTNAARVCWLLYYRIDPINKIIQHINRDPFDNRIENLRAVKL